MTTTLRVVRDDVQNVLDYLTSAELVLFANQVTIVGDRVSFRPYDRQATFLVSRDHPTIEQYLVWVSAGMYSAVLFDGSLLQITYDVSRKGIVGHRLLYLPCPYEVDTDLLAGGEPIADVIDLYRSGDALLRSPIRFDFDPSASKPGHPDSHFTLNSVDCRVACVAPVHVLRFADFVFRQFYHSYWVAHQTFFEAAAWRHIGGPAIRDAERRELHMMWDVNAAMSD